MDDSRLNHRVGSLVCAVLVAVTIFPLWFFAVLAAFSLKPSFLLFAGQQHNQEITPALQAFGRVLTMVCVSGIFAAALVGWLTFWILDRNYSTRRIPLVR
jgi:phosphatidylglycerophosphate synthase